MRRVLALTALLAVGEGDAELTVLNHLKTLYLPRGCGTTIKIRGGFGKGGKGVLDYAERISAGVDFDRRILVLDTDTDWDDLQRARARDGGFEVVESVPCLEAWLLEVHGDRKHRHSEGHKREFLRRFGREAHDERVYAEHFSRATLDGSRYQVATLHRLLSLLNA